MKRKFKFRWSYIKRWLMFQRTRFLFAVSPKYREKLRKYFKECEEKSKRIQEYFDKLPTK